MTRAEWQRGRRAWQRFGETEPYWSVLSHPQYRATTLDGAGRGEFFASGEADVARTLDEIRATVAPGFAPAAALDFGCGVGRLAIPLARRCERVVGVDVSEAMLHEARANCERLDVPNLELTTAGPPGDTLANVRGDFDLVHSYIVFQHIAPDAGYRILDDLLRRLRPGGVGALHFTFAWNAGLARRLAHRVRRGVPLANAVANLLQGRPLRQPAMAMYQYDPRRLYAALWARGCTAVHARLEEHAGHLGAMLLFRVR